MDSKKNENYTLEGFLNFRKVWSSVRKSIIFAFRFDKKRFITLIILAVISAVVPYLQNGLFAKLIDQTILYVKDKNNIENIFITTLVLIGATAVPGIVGLIRGFVSTKLRFNMIRELDLFVFKKTSSLDIATIESAEYQELTQKAGERGTSSIHVTNSYFLDNIINLFGVITSFSILYFLDKTLLIYAVIGVLPSLFVELKYGKDIYWIWDLNANNRRQYFNRRSHFSGTTALIELKLYQLTNKFLSEIKKILLAFDDELEQTEKNKLFWELGALVVFIVFLGISIWRIVNLATLGELAIGQMLFAYTTYRSFNGTLSEFFRKIGNITEYANYAGYWFQILDLQPKIKNSQNVIKIENSTIPPKIEFKNVSYRYDKQVDVWAIKDMNLIIEPGQKVAIVGLSGAGKTTLIKLLCRIYDPEEGHILIDNIDLRELDTLQWQKMLSVLFQDFISYNFTAREAIALGDPEKEINEKRLIEASKMAKAHDFIERLPKGYDQLLWKGFEDGVDLSKGERQRMALARVLYREAPITILDEPTASVDALAEQEIFATLEKLPKEKTVILISHRFSTVKNTDQIFVIEYGKLIEHGKHDALMKHKGKYSELYTIQKESYE